MSPFLAFRFRPEALAPADFLPRRLAVDFRAGTLRPGDFCGAGDGRLAAARFFAAPRLADFPVAAMAISH